MTKKKAAIKAETFTVDTIQEMGLCNPAIEKFRKKYGAQGFTLSSRKADIIDLLEQGKGEWVITFCMELMEEEQKIHFVDYVLEEVKRDFKGRTVSRICNMLASHTKGHGDYSQEINNARKILTEEINGTEVNPDDWAQQSVVALYRGLIHLIRSCSKGERATQRMTVAIRNFVEAYVLNKTAQDNFFPLEDYRVFKFKEFGLYAMKLTGVWPFE